RRPPLRRGTRAARRRLHRAAAARLERSARRRRPRRRRAAPRRVRRLRAADTAADAAAPPLPAAELLRHEPRDARGLRRAVGTDALPHPLPAGVRRLHGLPCRRLAAPVDGRDVLPLAAYREALDAVRAA